MIFKYVRECKIFEQATKPSCFRNLNFEITFSYFGSFPVSTTKYFKLFAKEKHIRNSIYKNFYKEKCYKPISIRITKTKCDNHYKKYKIITFTSYTLETASMHNCLFHNIKKIISRFNEGDKFVQTTLKYYCYFPMHKICRYFHMQKCLNMSNV